MAMQKVVVNFQKYGRCVSNNPKVFFSINLTCLYGKIVIFFLFVDGECFSIIYSKTNRNCTTIVFDWTSFYRKVVYCDGMIFSSIKNRYGILVFIIFTRFNCTFNIILLIIMIYEGDEGKTVEIYY